MKNALKNYIFANETDEILLPTSHARHKTGNLYDSISLVFKVRRGGVDAREPLMDK